MSFSPYDPSHRSVSVESPNGAEVVNDAMRRIQELEIPERAVEIVIYETRISIIDVSGNELKVPTLFHACASLSLVFLFCVKVPIHRAVAQRKGW